MNTGGLDFEKPIIELERKIEDLRGLDSDKKMGLSDEIVRLERRLDEVKKEIYENLTPWQRVQLARHPRRPYTMDYVQSIMTDFIELHGDRHFRDDKAIIAGCAKVNGSKVCVVGHQKGRDTKENLMRSFGSAHPEGYRKAMRIMYLAEKFGLPVICFIDTPGAYPGIGAEERGQAEAIAYNLREMASLKVPVMAIVIGEGGSGGALGIGVANRIAVLENAYYSVISPEGCAAILWKERGRAAEAADVLKLTAQDLLDMGIIEEIIREPLGGAHRDPAATAGSIKASIKAFISEYGSMPEGRLVDQRYRRFRKIGMIKEPSPK